MGRDPQTDKEIDRWGCAVAWMPVISVEVSNQMRQAGASIDTLRTEQQNQHEQNLETLRLVYETILQSAMASLLRQETSPERPVSFVRQIED